MNPVLIFGIKKTRRRYFSLSLFVITNDLKFTNSNTFSVQFSIHQIALLLDYCSLLEIYRVVYAVSFVKITYLLQCKTFMMGRILRVEQKLMNENRSYRHSSIGITGKHG